MRRYSFGPEGAYSKGSTCYEDGDLILTVNLAIRSARLRTITNCPFWGIQELSAICYLLYMMIQSVQALPSRVAGPVCINPRTTDMLQSHRANNIDHKPYSNQ